MFTGLFFFPHLRCVPSWSYANQLSKSFLAYQKIMTFEVPLCLASAPGRLLAVFSYGEKKKKYKTHPSHYECNEVHLILLDFQQELKFCH